MLQFSGYSKNLSELLIINNYEPVRGLSGDIVSIGTPLLGFVNTAGSAWYAVVIINARLIGSEEYVSSVKPQLDTFFEDLLDKYGKKNIIVLNMFVSENSSNRADFLAKGYFEFDRSVMNVYWEIGLYDGQLNVAKSNPDRISNLRELVVAALESGDNNSYSLDELYEKAVEKRPKLAEKGGPAPILTYILIIVNMLIFVAITMGGDRAAMLARVQGALIPQLVMEGEYYRLFSYMFLHANFMHLLNNCFSLYIFGSRVERYYGLPKTLVIYLLTGLFAGFVSILFVPFPTIGASGAVFGLLGAVLALAMRSKADIVGLNYPTIMLLTGISVLLGFTRPEINNHAHIGGLIAGFVLGMILFEVGKVGKKAEETHEN